MEELKHQLSPARQDGADSAIKQVSLQQSADEAENLNRNFESMRQEHVELDAKLSSSLPDSEYVQQLEYDLEESRRKCFALELQQVMVEQESTGVGQVRSPSPHILLAWEM